MRSRVLGAHLGVSFSSGMKIVSLPWGVSSRVAEVAVGVLDTFCSATVTTHTPLVFILTSVFSGFLEGLAPLVFMPITPFSDGCLGSNVDEGRSEVR